MNGGMYNVHVMKNICQIDMSKIQTSHTRVGYIYDTQKIAIILKLFSLDFSPFRRVLQG